MSSNTKILGAFVFLLALTSAGKGQTCVSGLDGHIPVCWTLPPDDSIGIPRIADRLVMGYHLYGDSLPNPFDRRPDTRIDCNFSWPSPWPDDPHCADVWKWCNGDSIKNGMIYYFQLTAVYDIGGGQYIEILDPQQISCMAENHPPRDPVDLRGHSVGRDVYLSWTPNTDYDMWYYNIYRKDPGDVDFHLTGSVFRPNYTFAEQIDIDGLYEYKIAAVDAESLQSVGYSNTVYIAIGSLPPICPFLPGDINGDSLVNGSDVVFGINYFKGGQAPPVDCHPLCMQNPDPFFAAGDVNGDCQFNGMDITFFVGYLKDQISGLLFCPGCPPFSR